MHHMVMFDLPTKTAEDRSCAAKFRNSLLKEGYVMIQYSVYVRFYKGTERRKSLEDRVKLLSPPRCNIRCLSLTSQQYKDMVVFIGAKKAKQEIALNEQYTLMF